MVPPLLGIPNMHRVHIWIGIWQWVW